MPLALPGPRALAPVNDMPPGAPAYRSNRHPNHHPNSARDARDACWRKKRDLCSSDRPDHAPSSELLNEHFSTNALFDTII